MDSSPQPDDLERQLASLESVRAVIGEAAYQAARAQILAQAKPAPQIDNGGGDVVNRDQVKAELGNVSDGATVVIGIGNTIHPGSPTARPEELRRAYLSHLFETAGLLQLTGIDPKAAGEGSSGLNLHAVYTALLTLAHEEMKPDRPNLPGRESRPLSALEQLNRHKRLVLLGDPGGGKSTFVNFVALCLAGEALGRPEANLALLTRPLPPEKDGNRLSGKEKEEPRPQPWEHGALLPVRVMLRDFAARGLPEAGQPASARHLWAFIAGELKKSELGEYAPLLKKELREKGGLLLVDGLDEVPEANERRAQIKQAVEDFARGFPCLRILVTSRTYAYQNQDWRLQGFADAVLAPFSRGQIEQFIERWYDHMAVVRNLDPQDAQGRAALLKQAVFSGERLRGLAERPLLLTLMASLHAWRGGSLPEKREELYADTVDLLLDWWESQRVVRGAKGEAILVQPSLLEWLKVDRARVRELLNELAFNAHAAQPELTGTADVPQAALVDGLMKLANNPDLRHARLIEYLRDRAGLLLPRGEGVFTFPHRTFQEYLAACYLTDHDYPDRIAELACADYSRWREVALLAGAKASRGTTSAVWTLADALCYAPCPPGPCPYEPRLWGAHLAAQALVESAALEKAGERNQLRLDRIRGWLVQIVEGSPLPATERALAGDSLARLGDPRAEVMTVESMPLCFVPGGPFRMGSEDITGDEKPQHEVTLPEYCIGQHPVSNAQFQQFVGAGGYTCQRYWPEARTHGYWSQEGFKGRWDDEPRQRPKHVSGEFNLPNHPVVGVTWYEALAFTRWLQERLPQGWGSELPSEAQWEKAARGGLQLPRAPLLHPLAGLAHGAAADLAANPAPGRTYPWGEDFDPQKANTGEGSIGATNAAGCFANAASPYGVLDMAGNVWEWTRSLSRDYPYDALDGREDLTADGVRVLRGGSWDFNGRFARCSCRGRSGPDDFLNYFGFRVVVLPILRSDL